MSKYKTLISEQKKWLVTGVAGFIGSNIAEDLLINNQIVVGLDNFSTGKKENLDEIKKSTGEKFKNFSFLNGSILDLNLCMQASTGIDYVIHQAALGSVPRSIDKPIASNEANVSGFLNIMESSMKNKVKSFTYASSSSVYGDSEDLPKVENKIGTPLSPYALTKSINEQYADIFFKNYGFKSTGLRYFNVFGKRQDPDGDYAAVIPKWTAAMIADEDVFINGDGETSRDFCYIENVVQANILAALSSELKKNEVYNIAVGSRTTLTELYYLLKNTLNENGIAVSKEPIYRDFRKGDMRHSHADIKKAITDLGYKPTHDLVQGINESMSWYIDSLS